MSYIEIKTYNEEGKTSIDNVYIKFVKEFFGKDNVEFISAEDKWLKLKIKVSVTTQQKKDLQEFLNEKIGKTPEIIIEWFV